MKLRHVRLSEPLRAAILGDATVNAVWTLHDRSDSTLAEALEAMVLELAAEKKKLIAELSSAIAGQPIVIQLPGGSLLASITRGKAAQSIAAPGRCQCCGRGP